MAGCSASGAAAPQGPRRLRGTGTGMVGFVGASCAKALSATASVLK